MVRVGPCLPFGKPLVPRDFPALERAIATACFCAFAALEGLLEPIFPLVLEAENTSFTFFEMVFLLEPFLSGILYSVTRFINAF